MEKRSNTANRTSRKLQHATIRSCCFCSASGNHNVPCI